MADHDPAPRAIRHVSTGPGDAPDPADGPFAIERMAALSHELNNLLDGSLRCLGLARRSLGAASAGQACVEHARRHVEAVYGALEHMADLVNAAMRSSSSVVGSPTLSPRHTIRIHDAIQHAIDVLTPEAQERGIVARLDLTPEAASVPVGPLYSVLLNGLRNAIESIAATGLRAGQIDVTGSLRPVEDAPEDRIDTLTIDIRDDGRGLPKGLDASRAFDFGYSTKPSSMGIGLALAREVVRDMGGSIDLLPRVAGTDPRRPGAILRISVPVPRQERS
ncbi:MAG: ATP-binding protein [Phycisphaerales bacterium]